MKENEYKALLEIYKDLPRLRRKILYGVASSEILKLKRVQTRLYD